ncbi:MAG: RNA polymerase factor sigma-70 [Planctomycetes bacterium]|jgi:RNA polymerase sigma-70 factor (ECF subfamily)|nr:RNA polymerase factor sigma-70 [Planctomycetota bacterium]MDP6423782.1 sigma-70 family RNA polymerase sigma factor [Planctomycetota bacterium]
MSESPSLAPLEEPFVQPHELFEILVREHEPRLRAFVNSLVRDPAGVDDVVQESFLVAWRNLYRYDRGKPFGPWLRGIGRRLCFAHYRHVSDQRVTFVEEAVVDHLQDLYALLDTASGDTLDEQLVSLRKCLVGLPEHQRDVLRLHYEEDLGCNAIADRQGRTRESIKKLLQRSRAWLGRCIEQRITALQGGA